MDAFLIEAWKARHHPEYPHARSFNGLSCWAEAQDNQLKLLVAAFLLAALSGVYATLKARIATHGRSNGPKAHYFILSPSYDKLTQSA
jgi:hypothetical protein